jgi:hypothetical protein
MPYDIREEPNRYGPVGCSVLIIAALIELTLVAIVSSYWGHP